jgi:hypothetical protein
MENRLARQKITADIIATFLSCVISLRLVDRLEVMSLLANATAGTAAAQILKRIAPGGEAWDVLVQCGLIYLNKDAGPLMSAFTSVWSAPIAFVSKTLSSTLLDHAMPEEHHVDSPAKRRAEEPSAEIGAGEDTIPAKEDTSANEDITSLHGAAAE